MGVVESSRGEGELNLHDLVIKAEESRDVLPFDPETEITEQEKGNIMQDLKDRIGKKEWNIAFPRARMIKSLFPEKKIELALNKEDWQKICDDRKRIIKFSEADNNSAQVVASEAVDLWALFPEKSEDFAFAFDEEAWQKMEARLEELRRLVKDGHTGSFADLAMNMAILFPDRTSELNLDEEIWQALNVYIIDEPTGKDVYISACALRKILFPERTKSMKFEPEAWMSMKETLHKCSPQNSNFLRQAYFLKVIAAKEVRVVNHRLEVTMPSQDKFREKEIPLPERRKF